MKLRKVAKLTFNRIDLLPPPQKKNSGRGSDIYTSYTSFSCDPGADRRTANAK